MHPKFNLTGVQTHDLQIMTDIFGVIWVTILTLPIENLGSLGVMSWLGGGLLSLSALFDNTVVSCSGSASMKTYRSI